MKTAGRASLVLILGVLSLLAFAGVFFIKGSTPTAAATEFMRALGDADVDALVQLSNAPGKTPEQLRKEWEYTTGIAGKHYRFAFTILQSTEANDNTASVVVHVSRNADTEATYPEKYELPMVKVDGDWLVDIRGINREMYPSLPR